MTAEIDRKGAWEATACSGAVWQKRECRSPGRQWEKSTFVVCGAVPPPSQCRRATAQLGRVRKNVEPEKHIK
jgi:hypothetical protein